MEYIGEIKGGIFMCDTMVALGEYTRDGSVLFAKNSDRQPNEPHIIIRVPAKVHGPGKKVKCTYIEVDQAEETYGVLLLKPSWIWGCEMGCNQFGLNIGNEAVFTKERYGKPALLGMDMVRLALERCKTSTEALHFIVELLGKYGQGGNCGYEKKFTYHNSFLIADSESAYVLETAGKYWAAEKVKDVRSISNCLTIGNKPDLCHPELIKHAVDMKWCRSEKDFNFARCYTDPLYTTLSGSIERFKTTSSILNKEKGNITIDTMKRILRSHDKKSQGRQFSRASLKSVCMHGGFIIGDHTTGSYIASIDKKMPAYFITGSSTPCISVFKPFFPIDGESMTFKEGEEEKATAYWAKREMLHRLVLSGSIDLEKYLPLRDALEKELENLVESCRKDSVDEDRLLQIMNYAIEKENELVEDTINSSSDKRAHIKGSPYFRHYWNAKNISLIYKNFNH